MPSGVEDWLVKVLSADVIVRGWLCWAEDSTRLAAECEGGHVARECEPRQAPVEGLKVQRIWTN